MTERTHDSQFTPDELKPFYDHIAFLKEQIKQLDEEIKAYVNPRVLEMWRLEEEIESLEKFERDGIIWKLRGWGNP